MINIAVLGYGTVGSGVFEVVRTNREIIENKVKDRINIKYVLDLRDFPGDPVEEVLVHDFETIVNDPEVKIVTEVMGGLNPAFDFVKRSLMAGKSVCTSNKELVARHGTELLGIAKENRVNFLFEASCGGGIPIIRALCDSLASDRIGEISGILNGTTNYILTKMQSEGTEFSEALKSAQDKGFAERNPEADIEGYDACRKIAILSSLAFGKTIDFEDIYTEGITKITKEDIAYAAKLGYTIKLVASCGLREGKCYALVTPLLIERGHPLFSVDGVFNAVFVKGNMLGPCMFYGRGAGKLPTASAVVSDIVWEACNMDRDISPAFSAQKLMLEDIGGFKRRFFVRVCGDKEEKKAEIEGLFGEVESYGFFDDEFCFVTEEMTEKDFFEAYEKLSGAVSRIRINS